MKSIIDKLHEISHKGKAPQVLVDCGPDKKKYDDHRQVFNRKFQFRPTAIVLCECTEHVQQVVNIARDADHKIRVRSGGHDHEGECSGTDTILIDLSKMKSVKVEKATGLARIQPGIRFLELVPKLGEKGVCIPHGTCATVGIAGFTMGGGWGPWTRRYGMCCESLVGATIVLGDGEAVELTPGCKQEELLWALRGGGGMSYGIVTELVFQTFELPKETIKFEVNWDHSSAFKVLKLWEGLIAPGKNPNLIGTNLKIMAIPKPKKGNIKESVHKCTFYGYYTGTQVELKAEMKIWFEKLPPTDIISPDDNNDKTKQKAFSAWDRVSTVKKLQSANAPKRLFSMLDLDSPHPLRAETIPPDLDAPAPHKITSRVVAESGWNDKGRETLIRSIESDLLYDLGEEAQLLTYVTLGAITGNFYPKYKEYPQGSAFPYKKRPFFIQYQAWWDQGADGIKEGNKHNVHKYTNRAEDWIEECRKEDFPETSGSFISFKDASVPTRNYFMQSYEQLKMIKDMHSKDPENRFRSRKTII